jgi:predicted CoA-substrate-specific enzyme activase
MIFAGIDAGSRATKIVLIDGDDYSIVAKGIRPQNVHSDEVAQSLLNELIDESRISDSDIKGCVATGYSRNIITRADSTITEITCHGCGVHHLVPEARTIVEIGGQDSKVLHLSENGSVFDFSMNDRCAAGTGRFLEVVADRLHVDLHELGALAAKSEKPAVISSMCIVFAETEIIGLLAAGAEPANIVAGVQNAVTTRVASMMGRNVVAPVVFTGGVAMVTGMDAALERSVKKPIAICPDAQYTGALGAALMATRK